jgi:hypothetical protein
LFRIIIFVHQRELLYSTGLKKKLVIVRNGILLSSSNGKVSHRFRRNNFYVKFLKISGSCIVRREIVREKSLTGREKFKKLAIPKTKIKKKSKRFPTKIKK